MLCPHSLYSHRLNMYDEKMLIGFLVTNDIFLSLSLSLSLSLNFPQPFP